MQASATGKEARQVFQHVIKHPDAGIVVVAEHKNGICAYGYGAFEWRSEFGGETMHCVELFVEQAWRQRGVAGSLLASLIDVASQRGIYRISAEVHPGNATIERILEASGFDPEHRTVWGRRL
jgi:GNAT superfamily N-acetyltransferase